MRADVVALYVDPLGPYPSLVAEWFDAGRDARTYTGDLPVVAHPPCGPWGILRARCSYPDGGLAPHAVTTVRRVGGVLEHPRGSALWAELGLPRPGQLPDAFGGRTIEVEQVRWGHPARKRTWLYLVRTTLPIVIPPPRDPTHWCSGHRYASRGGPDRAVDAPPPGIKVCSAQQRRRTPTPFAEWLLELAASAATIDR